MNIKRIVSGVLAVGLVSLVSPVAAADERQREQWYVAPWGQDQWPGTMARPFATLARAQQAVRARTARMKSDIVVNLRGGTHTLTAPLRLAQPAGDSGRNGHRVIYQAYGYGTPKQEPVTVSGGREISGWQPDERTRGVWRAEVGGLESRQLYVDDRRAGRASLGAGLPGRLKTTRTGYVTNSTVPQSWRNPRDIELAYTFPFWIDARCGVAGISGNSEQTTITMDQPCWKLARATYGDENPLGGPTNVTNSVSFLRKPGTWYLDRSRPGHHALLYRPRPGEDMRRTKVVAPVLQTLVQGAGRPGDPLHDVSFKGFTFAHATWLAPSEPAGFVSAWSMYKRPGVKTWLTVPGNVVFHTADRITFEGDRFRHLGGQALEFSKSSSYNLVQGNVFTDVSDGGVLMGVTHPDTKGTNHGNRIVNNWIHHTGVEYRGASAIWDTATQDTTLAHNQINDVPYTGILSGPDADLGITRRHRILNNKVFRTNQVLSDGGGIYLRGRQGTSFADGAVVSGNAVTDARKGDFNIGIYTDDGSSWITVRGNAAYDYLSSIGGCDEPGRPVQDIRFRQNFWDDAVPAAVKRRSYPGAWPDAAEECGDPKRLEFTGNTLLAPRDPAKACDSKPVCAAIVANAGLQPPYRRLLQAP